MAAGNPKINHTQTVSAHLLADSSSEPSEPSATSRSWITALLSLERTRKNGNLSGLCSALSETYGIDGLLVRVFFFIATFASGLGIFVYLACWFITREKTTGSAPADIVIPRWRKIKPEITLGLIGAIILLLVVRIGSFTPAGWPPLLIVLFAIWTGQRITYSSVQRLESATSIPAVRSRWLLPTALVTLTATCAGLVTYDLSDRNVIAALAVALALVGVGLIVLGFQTNPLGLIVVGTAISLALCAATGWHEYRHSSIQDRSITVETIQSWQDLGDYDYASVRDASLDLSPVTMIPADHHMTITLDQSSLMVAVSSQVNVEIEPTIKGLSDIRIADLSKRFTSSDHEIYRHQVDPASPILYIHVSVENSDLQVVFI